MSSRHIPSNEPRLTPIRSFWRTFCFCWRSESAWTKGIYIHGCLANDIMMQALLDLLSSSFSSAGGATGVSSATLQDRVRNSRKVGRRTENGTEEDATRGKSFLNWHFENCSILEAGLKFKFKSIKGTMYDDVDYSNNLEMTRSHFDSGINFVRLSSIGTCKQARVWTLLWSL